MSSSGLPVQTAAKKYWIQKNFAEISNAAIGD